MSDQSHLDELHHKTGVSRHKTFDLHARLADFLKLL
jgi:hypothetical protein